MKRARADADIDVANGTSSWSPPPVARPVHEQPPPPAKRAKPSPTASVWASFSSTKTDGTDSGPYWELRTDHKQFLYITHPGNESVLGTPVCELRLLSPPPPLALTLSSSAGDSLYSPPPLTLVPTTSRAPWSSSNDRSSSSSVTRYELDRESKEKWKRAMKLNRIGGQLVQGWVHVSYTTAPNDSVTVNLIDSGNGARHHTLTIPVGWRTGKEEKRRSRDSKKQQSDAVASTAIDTDTVTSGRKRRPIAVISSKGSTNATMALLPPMTSSSLPLSPSSSSLANSSMWQQSARAFASSFAPSMMTSPSSALAVLSQWPQSMFDFSMMPLLAPHSALPVLIPTPMRNSFSGWNPMRAAMMAHSGMLWPSAFAPLSPTSMVLKLPLSSSDNDNDASTTQQ